MNKPLKHQLSVDDLDFGNHAVPALLPAEYKLILRSDYMSFIERSYYELHPHSRFYSNWIGELLASKLDACRLGKIKRLIINLPPRHLKSHSATVCLPAWWLGHQPGARIICASYNQELAEKFARESRRLMMSSWYQSLFHTRLSDRQAVHDFETTDHGGRLATSVGGTLTGRGGDVIIIDDPIKPNEMSATSLDSTIEWYRNTLLSRLDSKIDGCIIIAMQRLHLNDLVGHVLEEGGWEVVSLPAIAQDDEHHLIETPLGRRIVHRTAGELLSPEREPMQTLDRMRAGMSPANFSAQYLQQPVPEGGDTIKNNWLRYYTPIELPKRFSRIVQSWDTANKAKEINDFSVCTTWGVDGKRLYLLDVFRERLVYPDLKRKVVAMQRRFEANSVLIEDKASGTQLIQDLRCEIYGIVPFKPAPGTDKHMRLRSVSDMFENGFVYLPAQAPWLDMYVQELTSFPTTKWDDQVDSTSQALTHLRTSSSLAVWEALGRARDIPSANYSAYRRSLFGPYW